MAKRDNQGLLLPKVVAYITRKTKRGTELLFFRHPRHVNTPIQVPQGTVEQGNSFVFP